MIIEIDKAAIPYEFEMELGGEIFAFTIRYNDRFDFFTIDLKKDSELIIAGQKVVYGRPLFAALSDQRLPKVDIIPINESGQPIERITFDNFGSSVVLLVGDAYE